MTQLCRGAFIVMAVLPASDAFMLTSRARNVPVQWPWEWLALPATAPSARILRQSCRGRLGGRTSMTQTGRARCAGALVGGLAALTITAVALAHHSFAMFDSDHQVKLSGTVKSFQWTNPHVYIEMDGRDVKDEKAAPRHYTIECASPGILNRVGWKFNMVKPGDAITVIIAPLRTGEPGGLLKQITLADGRKFSNGGPAGKPNIE